MSPKLPLKRIVFASSLIVTSLVMTAGCSAPDDEASSSEDELVTAATIGVTCKTLGDLGSCDATELCKTVTEGSCEATPSGRASDPYWDRQCPRLNQQLCGFQLACSWKAATKCVPRTGAPTDAQADLAVACQTVGEIGACERVSACKSLTGTCQMRLGDYNWMTKCPEVGATPELCPSLHCKWEEPPTKCVPRGDAVNAADIGTACMTFGAVGMCSKDPRCKEERKGLCKPASSAASPSTAQACSRFGMTAQMCGFQPLCRWEETSTCLPRQGPQEGSVIDLARACRTLGPSGSCESVPVCRLAPTWRCAAKPTASGGTRPADEERCRRYGPSLCEMNSLFCRWEQTTECVPAGQ